MLGAVALVLGFIISYQHRNATPPTPPVPPAGPVEQGAVTAIIDSTTAFAKALKDLEFGGRLMTVGVLLIAISALAAGLDEVAQAVTDVADAVKTG